MRPFHPVIPYSLRSHPYPYSSLSCSGQELPEVAVVPLAESSRVTSVEGTHEVIELCEAKMTLQLFKRH